MNRVTPQSFMSQEDQGYFTVELELPEGATIERTRQVTERAMAYLLSDPDVEHVLNVNGSSPRVGTNQAHSALTVILKPWNERATADIGEIRERIRKELSSYPESNVYIFTPAIIPGLGTSGGFEMVLEARGDASYEDLQNAVDTLKKYAPMVKAVTDLSTSMQADIPQLYFDVDRDRAKMQGIPVSDIFSTMKAFTGSIYVNDFNLFNRIYRVYIQAEAPYRISRDNLNLFFVRSADGAMVCRYHRSAHHNTPLALAQYSASTCSTPQPYQARPPTATVSARPCQGLEKIVRQHLPENIGVEWSGLSYQQKHEIRQHRAGPRAGIPVRIPIPCRPIRKLDSTAGRHPVTSCRRGRRISGHMDLRP